MSGSVEDPVKMMKKSKKTKKKRQAEAAAGSGGGGGASDGYSNSKTDKARRGGPGSGRRRLLLLLLLAIVAATALLAVTRSGGAGEVAAGDEADAAGLQQEAAQGDGKAKQKKKKGPSDKDEDENGGDEEELKIGDVNVIQSAHGNLGWNKLQGPLVTKRPPRECSIKRIRPQVTSPFYVVSKKDKWKRRLYTCLRFGKKACPSGIMDDFVARRWKLKAVAKALENRIQSTFVLTDSLTLVKLQQSKPLVFAEMYARQEGSTYLNALLGGGGLDGGILEQHAARAGFTQRFGCPYNALKIQPQQFRFDVYAECAKMENAFAKHPSDSWMMHALSSDSDGNAGSSGSSSGPAATIVTAGQETRTLATTAALAEPPGFCASRARYSAARDSRVLASMAVKEPLKLEGKLFDVRSYILVGSTMPMMVFFQPGFIRKAGSSGQAASPYFFDQGASTVGLDAFQEHLAKEKITGSHYVETFLQSSMKQIALFVFHAARRKVQRRRGSYQLFSVDYVVDKSFRVYLEKTGGNPDLHAMGGAGGSVGFDPGPMVADMHDLVMELHEVPVAFESMVKGDKYGKWELIFSELRESCHRIVYNPCHLFIDFNDKELTKQNRKVGRVQATAKRLENEQKRIVKKTEEKKKAACRDRKVPYPGTKCNKLLEEMDKEEFNALFAEHEQSFNPNEFRLAEPGEVFPHEIV